MYNINIIIFGYVTIRKEEILRLKWKEVKRVGWVQ